MVFLISLLIGIQVLSAWPADPSPNPAPLPLPDLLLFPGCYSSDAEAAADLALEEINAHRTEGYVFTLQRIFDVAELPVLKNTSVLFIITLDVLETKCHVLSRKSYKNCTIQPLYEMVYGQCTAFFFIDREQEITSLEHYICNVQPLPRADLARLCPDCPVPGDPTAPKFQDAAAASLARFNAENNNIHYFRLLNVTKGSSECFFGPKTYVEYTIQETSCSKTALLPDISSCPFLPLEIATVGLCKASVTYSRIKHQDFLTTDCELYLPLPPAPPEEGPKPQKDNRHVDDESHEDGHQYHRNEKHRLHRLHRRKPHHRHHGTNSHEQQGGKTPSHTFQCPPKKTVGRVMVLPPSSSHVSLRSLPPISIPPNPSFPNTQGAPQEHHPRPDKPGQANFTICSISVYLPFLAAFSQSVKKCPGNFIIEIPGLPFVQMP